MLIEKYVNTRIENAKKAGQQVNAGAISVECANAMTGPTSLAVHGKLLLKGVIEEFSCIDTRCKHWIYLSPNQRMDVVIFSRGVLEDYEKHATNSKNIPFADDNPQSEG